MLLEGRCISVGSSPSASVQVEDSPFVSRVHFELERTDDAHRSVLVTSRSTTNSTFLNGYLLEKDMPTPVVPDEGNACFQCEGCKPSDPIIFCNVPNKAVALQEKRLAQCFRGFTLALLPSTSASAVGREGGTPVAASSGVALGSGLALEGMEPERKKLKLQRGEAFGGERWRAEQEQKENPGGGGP